MYTKSSDRTKKQVVAAPYWQYGILTALGICVIIAFIIFTKGGELIPVIGSFY